jgi:exopolysaccharide production protein ExoQ
MSQILALCLYSLLIAWLLLDERKRCPDLSGALWLPFIWLAIISSRPLSTWFGFNLEFNNADDYLEGSPFDRLVFMLLIALALIVLLRRHLQWHAMLSENKYIFLLFAYLLISTLWSPYSFTAFKRWIKDIGNLIMALIILTDQKPFEALQTVFIRCASLLIPLSVLFIKYFPELGRSYNRWTYLPVFTGVTTNKNLLGMMVFVCGVFVLWSLLLATRADAKTTSWRAKVSRMILILMTIWLLYKAQSSTALGTMILTAILFFGTRFNILKRRISRIGTYIVIGALVLSLLLTLGVGEIVTEMLGRDATLTGRTDIWRLVLEEKINPLLGVGYYSFWLGERNQRLSEGYYYNLGEAHNGYIEIYLNVGLIGLLLFYLLLYFSHKNIAQTIRDGDEFGFLRLVLFAIVLIYATTEAVFNRMNPLWFGFLAVIMKPQSAQLLRPLARAEDTRNPSLFSQKITMKQLPKKSGFRPVP